MTMMKRFVIAGVVVGLGLAVGASPAAAGTARPDGEVKRKGDAFVGHGVINDTGEDQRAVARRAPGEKAVFKFRYENVGSATDDFEVESCGTPMVFNVRFFRDDREVTDKLAEGPITVRDVAPGARTPVITVKVKVRNGVVGPFTIGACLKATASNPVDRDAPVWLVRVAP